MGSYGEKIEKLGSSHRRHLRKILNVGWPNNISNKELYKRTKVTALSCRIKSARWNMIGNVLRQGENKPAYLAFYFAINEAKNYPACKGRPPINLLDQTIRDLLEKGIIINSSEDIREIREKAKNKDEWERM